MSAGKASSWSVTPSNAFAVFSSSDSTQAVVTATKLTGQVCTLRAVVNGTTVTKLIGSCNIGISGPGTIGASTCTATFSVSSGSLTSGYSDSKWNISNGLSGLSYSGLSATFDKAASGFYSSSSSTMSAQLEFSFKTYVNGSAVTHTVAPKTIALQKAVPVVSGVYESSSGAPVSSGVPGTTVYELRTSSTSFSDYRWKYSAGSSSESTLSGFSPVLYFQLPGDYLIRVEGYDGCGWSRSANRTFPVYAPYSVYPTYVTSSPPTLAITRHSSVPQTTGSGGYALINIASPSSTPCVYGTLNFSNNDDSNFTVNTQSCPSGTYIFRILRSGTVIHTQTIIKGSSQ